MMMMMTNLFKRKIFLIIFFILIFIAGFVYYYNFEKNKTNLGNKIQSIKSLPIFKEKDLAVYNGDNPNKPIYIGLDGYVYDVTKGREFYKPGGSYHDLAGRDSTKLLRIFGGEIIKRKYPIIGRLEK